MSTEKEHLFAVGGSFRFTLQSDREFLAKYGKNEVTVPDTLLDNGVDIAGGFFDQAIFGPIKDYCCRCGELSGAEYEGQVCPNCGVPITTSHNRKTAMGYFYLNTPMLQPLYADLIATKILGLKKSAWRGLVFANHDFYLIRRPDGIFTLKNQLDPKASSEGVSPRGPSSEGARAMIYCSVPDAEGNKEHLEGSKYIFLGTGIDFITKFQELVDVRALASDGPFSEFWADKLNLLDWLADNLYTEICRVIPVAYRDFHVINGSLTIDTLNITYKSLKRIAVRLGRYQENPDYQEMPSYWQDVGRMETELAGLYLKGDLTFKGKVINSYKNILDHKEGMIRSNLLAKRSIFSARTVNTSATNTSIDLKEDELLVPYYMAKNLLRPHLLAELSGQGMALSSAQQAIDDNSEAVITLLHLMDGRYYVYTTRAPCLYKHSFMAFRMKINFDQSNYTLQVSSLLNVPFNLDQ